MASKARDAVGADIGPIGQIYVVGEVEEPDGPVKIGVTAKGGSRTGRSGLSGGNWRQLEVLHRWDLPLEIARWTEFIVHRNLRPCHRRGEWFDTRPLARQLQGWQPLLERASKGQVPGLPAWRLTNGGHSAIGVRRLTVGEPRHFEVTCDCGVAFDGGEGRSLDTVLTVFAVGHLELDPRSELVRDIKGWRMARPSPVTP
jgi:hypothetical protein